MKSSPDESQITPAALSDFELPPGVTGAPGPLMRAFRDYRVLFLVVGGLNTAIGFGWFILFDLTIGKFWGYMATLLFAHVASVLCAFVLYRKIVFRVKGHVWRDLARFESVYLVAIAVNAALLPLLVSVVGLQPIVSQGLIVVVTTFISFFGHKKFSFHRAGNSAQHFSKSEDLQ